MTETISRLLSVVNFFTMCCYRFRLVFNCYFYDTDISLGSVVTHSRYGEILSDSVATNLS